MSWTGGTISGAGTLAAQNGLYLGDPDTNADEYLSGVTLDNAGIATLSANTYNEGLVLTNGAIFDNQPGASLTIETNIRIFGDSMSTFINAGSLIQVQSAPAVTAIDPTFNQTSTGSTLIQGGGLLLRGGGAITGPITADASASLEFGAGAIYNLDAFSSLTSPTVVFAGDTFTDAGAYDVSGSTLVTSDSTVGFNAAISDLGNDLEVDNSTLSIATDQSLNFTTLGINGGTLSGLGSGNLTITGSLTWAGGTISGFGTVSVSSQAALTLGAANNSLNEELTGITLDNAGIATLSANTQNEGLVLTNGAIFDNQPGASLRIETNIRIFGDSTSTFINAGSLIQVQSVPAVTAIDPTFNQTSTGSTLIQGGGLLLRGGGAITGPITADAGASLEFGAGATYNLDAFSSLTSPTVVFAGDTFTDAGAYDVSGSTLVTSGSTVGFKATISDVGNDLEVDNSTLSITTDQSFNLTTLGVNGATLSGPGSGNLTITSSMTWAGGTISGFGTVFVSSQAALTLGAANNSLNEKLIGITLDNAGAATWEGGSVFFSNGAVFNNQAGATFQDLGTGGYFGSSDGNGDLAPAPSAFNNAGTYAKTGSGRGAVQTAFNNTGTVTVQAGELDLSSTSTNAGIIEISARGTLSVNNYSQTAGSTTLSGGTLSGGPININAGALTGPGTINADVIDGSEVIPGGAGAAGTLTINGNYTQTASGTLNIDLGGTTAGGQYDQLAVVGTASLGGMVNVALINAFQPTLGNTFQVLTFASSSGGFNFYNGIVLSNGLILDPTLNPTNLTLAVQPAVTTTALSTSPSRSVSGQSVAFTATVSAAVPPTTTDPTPTGIVTFYDNGASIGTGTLNVLNGHEQVTFSTSTLSTASHTITAAYTSGDANFVPSPVSPAVTQVVNRDSTTTTASASPSSANLGQTVTFTATVSANSPGSGTPTGSVDFVDTTTNADLTPGGVALALGTASFATTSLSAGTHTIKGTYSSDGNFLASSTNTGTVSIGQSIIVLDPSAGGALSLSGNASINLPGRVYVDSSSSSALSASGNAEIKATVIDVHGGVQKSGNASFSPAPITLAATTPDPHAALASPSTSGLTNYGSESLSGNSSATIEPGIYSQISASGNGTLTFDSGLYIIEGGGLTVSGNASVTDFGVTIFNAGNKYSTTGGTYGSISLSGNGSYNLSPPTSGTYAGVVIFQSRDNTKVLTLSGNASGMTGTIYAPAAELTESGNAQVNVSLDVDLLSISGNGIANTITLSSPSGTVAYTPAQIRAAYGINGAAFDGTGQTIALVDAYDDPSIYQALDGFDSEFGLTSSGSTLYSQYGPASSFLTVLNQYGQATSLPSTDPNGPGTDNWEVEEALDVEWAHAVAPGAQIIVVEANSQSLSDLMASVATAASQPGVSVVSMSWGFAEGQSVFASDEARYDSVFTTPGVTFVASTGDYGAADPEYPAFSPNVVAVGGTSLALNADGSYKSETGWGYRLNSVGAFIASGGGISLYEPGPAYQLGVQSTGSRTTPDVAFVADPATGAWIADPYNLDPSDPFEIVGGTSLSAPAWAGMMALVDQGRADSGESALDSTSPTATQQALYMLPQSDYKVIASGSNGYSAQAGYNLVTGLGTPVASLLVPDLIAYHGPGTSFAGPTVAPLQHSGLVNTGGNNGGPMDVFSVFDSLTVTSNGLADAQSPFSSTDLGLPVQMMLAPTGPGRIATSSLIAVAITVGPATNLSPTGAMPLPPTGVTIIPIATGFISEQLAWSTARPVVNAPATSAHSVVLERTVHDSLDPLFTGFRSSLVPDPVLDELATDVVRVRGWRPAGTGSVPVLPWDGVATGAPMVVDPVPPGTPLQPVSAIPAGMMPAPLSDGPRLSAAPNASLADILLAAGFCSFGARTLAAGRRRTARPRLLRYTRGEC